PEPDVVGPVVDGPLVQPGVLAQVPPDGFTCVQQETDATVATVTAGVEDEVDAVGDLSVRFRWSVGEQGDEGRMSRDGGVFTATFSVAHADELSSGGEVSVEVIATDTSGNTTTATQTIELDRCVALPPRDLEPPVIVGQIEPGLLLQVPPQGQFCFGGQTGSSERLTVSGTVSDPTDSLDDIRVFVGWTFRNTTASFEVPLSDDGFGSFQVTTSIEWREGWDDGGPLQVTATAFDAAGNPGRLVRDIELDVCTPDFVIK
ncbi:MAG TPA: hypothetical protein VFT95_07800, partial [Micromonosporaceae bacterium]|nr:hypothetical protein [Micromonosporaceae bacterium]